MTTFRILFHIEVYGRCYTRKKTKETEVSGQWHILPSKWNQTLGNSDTTEQINKQKCKWANMHTSKYSVATLKAAIITALKR